MRYIFFVMILLIFTPILIISYFVIVLFTMIKYRSKSVLSSSLYMRSMMHILKLRNDPIAEQLLYKIYPKFLCDIFNMPIKLGVKLTGYIPKLWCITMPEEAKPAQLETVSTAVIDSYVNIYLNSIEQFVLLEPGYDTRSFKFIEETNIKAFELDLPKIQTEKINFLKELSVDISFITFVSVDFSQEAWLQKVVESGFDKEKKTLFIWEGISTHLSKVSAEHILTQLSEISAEGSVIFMNLISRSIVNNCCKMRSVSKKNQLWGLNLEGDWKQELNTILLEKELALEEFTMLGQDTKYGCFCVVAVFKKHKNVEIKK